MLTLDDPVLEMCLASTAVDARRSCKRMMTSLIRSHLHVNLRLLPQGVDGIPVELVNLLSSVQRPGRRLETLKVSDISTDRLDFLRLPQLSPLTLAEWLEARYEVTGRDGDIVILGEAKRAWSDRSVAAKDFVAVASGYFRCVSGVTYHAAKRVGILVHRHVVTGVRVRMMTVADL